MKCNSNGYYLAGIYKGGCDQLHCIELLFCCKMMTGKGSQGLFTGREGSPANRVTPGEPTFRTFL